MPAPVAVRPRRGTGRSQALDNRGRRRCPQVAFERLARRCDRPNVLRPTVALLTAHQAAAEALTKQVQRSIPGKYAGLIAKRFAHSRSSRGCEAEVAGVTFMLRIAAVACRFRPTLDLLWRQLRSVLKRPFRIEGLARHALYEHNATGRTGATGIRIQVVYSRPERGCERDRAGGRGSLPSVEFVQHVFGRYHPATQRLTSVRETAG